MPPDAAPPVLTEMGQPLARQRCRNHVEREAAARCPSCGRFFCRECVTEHAGRVICATCLRQILAAPTRRTGSGRRLAQRLGAASWRAAQAAAGLVVAWTCFQYLAENLIALPAKFHETTLWLNEHGIDTDSLGGNGDDSP